MRGVNNYLHIIDFGYSSPWVGIYFALSNCNSSSFLLMLSFVFVSNKWRVSDRQSVRPSVHEICVIHDRW